MARLIRTAPWTHEAGHVLISGPVPPPAATAEFQDFSTPAAAPPVDTGADELATRRIAARAQAGERRRISRLLHDEIGQSLTALNVQLAVIRGRSRGPTQTHIGAAQRLLEKALGDVQRLSQELHPSAVEDLGLIPAVRSHIKIFSQKAALDVHFRADDRVQPSDMDLSLGVFRSIQALLADLETSAAARAVVFLGLAPNALLLDASARISRQHARDGDAAPNIATFHEQVLLAGGTVHFRARRNQALIRARFPMADKTT